jgi:DNA-binding NtrC family response regulator
MAAPESDKTVLDRGYQTALLIGPSEEDRELLNAVFAENGWTLEVARALPSATSLLPKLSGVSVVITERDLPRGDWKQVLKRTQQLEPRPLVIVISRIADEYLWSEALNLGAYDVLAKPLDRTEVQRALTSAWSWAEARMLAKESQSVAEGAT